MVRLSPASSLFPYTTLFRSLSPPRTPADPFSVGSHGKTYRSALVEWITLTPDNLRWTSKHAAHLGQRLAVEIQARGRFQNLCNRRIGRSLFSTSSHIGKFRRTRAPCDL